MKTSLIFYDYDSKLESRCGDSLEIDVSSKNLSWKNIILEKGKSPDFYPTNVATPYFYFALSIENELSWTAFLNDQKMILNTNKGEIWINPPHTPFTHEINEPCHFIILALEEDFVLRIVKQMNCSLTSSLECLNNYNVDDDVMRRFIELVYFEVVNEGKNGGDYLESLIKTISIYFIKNYTNFNDLIAGKHKLGMTIDYNAISKIDNFIDNHINMQISIDELAGLVNLSKFHFLREFKRMIGNTPYQYVLLRRIERAKKYLENQHTTIIEIATQLGFADQSHFSRLFKSNTGLTPAEYRDRFKSNNVQNNKQDYPIS